MGSIWGSRRNLIVLITLSRPRVGVRLSPRQRRLARLLVLGCDCPQIATLLAQPRDAVSRETARLMRRLGVANRAALRRAARRLALVAPGDRLSVPERRCLGWK
ncbi:MAG: hypothetical protein JW818_08180 [Pirellulales bacterium]|nr:hypothetical protein [Pirellulales bacterium]